MAFESLSKYQNTINRSQRDINKQFNQVEFNRIFEQNYLINKHNIQSNYHEKPNIIIIIIIIIIIMIGILLLYYNEIIIFFLKYYNEIIPSKTRR